MKLEIGKKYLTRDGREIVMKGLRRNNNDVCECVDQNGEQILLWLVSGTLFLGGHRESGVDVVSEVIKDGPVREVTRKEIVPGDYGKVRVVSASCIDVFVMCNVEEIRATIETLTGIADALESGN